MARNVSLTELRAFSRELADQETTTSTFVDDTELNRMINASVGQWHGMVALAVPERYEATQALSITGATSYALPSDYFATLGLDYVSGTDRTSLPRVQFNDRNRYGFATTPGMAQGYRISAGTIILLPPPTSGSYNHVYITAAPVLAGSDTMDGVNGWEQWIVFDVAAKMLIKEESDPSMVLSERNRIQVEIQGAAAERDWGHPRKVQDVRPKWPRIDASDFWMSRQ